MKKCLCMLMAAVLALSGVLFLSGMGVRVAEAEALQSCLDIVVLLDMSKSMEVKGTKSGPNDPNGYRIDATEMVISMADMNGTRVAVIPFAGNVFTSDIAGSREKADKDFVEIKTDSARNEKLSSVERMRKGQYMPSTNIGEALAVAYNLIREKSDPTHKPMVVLLTDGSNDFGDDSYEDSFRNKPQYVYNEETKFFELLPTGDSRRVDKASEMLALANRNQNKALELFEQEDVPVYFVPLAGSVSDKPAQEDLAGRVTKASDAVTGDNVKQLPDFFADFFAERIGSQKKQLEVIEDQDGYYKVIIPILNKSIMEANIYLPTANVEKDTIGLYYMKDGQEVKADNKHFERYSDGSSGSGKGNFVLYKVKEGAPTGVWILKFKPKAGVGKEAAKKIIFSLLYNYKVELMVQDTPTAIEKGDTLNATAAFVSIDGSTVDPDLYRDWAGEYSEQYPEVDKSWWTVDAAWQLLDQDGNPVKTKDGTDIAGDMRMENNQYKATIDLKKFYAGNPELFQSGTYTLRTKAEGAGLNKIGEQQLVIKNSNPPATPLKRSYNVDFPEGGSVANKTSDEINLTALYIDPNGDPVSFDPPVVTEDADKVTLNMDSSTGEYILKVTLKPQSDGTYGGGHVKGTIKVRDTDRNGTAQDFPFEFKIVSALDSVTSFALKPEFKAGVTGGKAEKNTTVRFEASLTALDDNSNDDMNNLDDWSESTFIVMTAGGGVVYDSHSMERDGDVLKGEFTTPDTACAWILEVTGRYNGKDAVPQTLTVTVENSAPEKAEFADEAIAKAGSLKFMPDSFINVLVNLLEKATPDETLTINAGDFLLDKDNEANLTYTLEEKAAEGVDENPTRWQGQLVIAQEEGAFTWNLTPETKAGKDILGGAGTWLKLTAKDGDGAETVQWIKVTVTNLTAKWGTILMVALVIVTLLVIIIITVHQIRKPRFPLGARLCIREGAALFDSEVPEIPTTKKPCTMNDYVSADLAEKTKISGQTLANIRLTPNRKFNRSVNVQLVKPNVAQSVTLDGVAVGKKATEWPVAGVMTVVGEDGGFLTIILSNEEQFDNIPVGDDPFGGSLVTQFGEEIHGGSGPVDMGGGFDEWTGSAPAGDAGSTEASEPAGNDDVFRF